MSGTIQHFGSSETKKILQVNQNLNITNYLRVKELQGINFMRINNYCSIYKNLVMDNTIGWLDNEFYPIIGVNSDSSDSILVKGNVNCFFDILLYNLISEKNIELNLTSNYEKNINIESFINVKKLVNTEYSQGSDEINESNTRVTNNLLSDDNISCNNSNVNYINTKYLNLRNINISSNANCNQEFNINVNKKLNIKKDINIYGNLNILNNIYINSTPNNSLEESRLILPTNKLGYTTHGALRYNDIHNTIEGFFQNSWRPISHLYSENYNNALLISENNNSNTSNNFTFIKNNNIAIEANHTANSLNLFSKNNIFKHNVNIQKSLSISNNLNVKNVTTNNNISVNGTLKIGYDNIEQKSYDGQIRYNSNNNMVQLYYNNDWRLLKFYSDSNGIRLYDNDDINIYIKDVNSFKLNSTHSTLDNNLNISKNCKLNNQINNRINVNKNLNIYNKNIIFNDKNILNYNSILQEIQAFVAPNYNSDNLSDYKTMIVGEHLASNHFNPFYSTSILFVEANYNIYKSCVYDYFISDNIIINYEDYAIYNLTETVNVKIYGCEIKYFIKKSNLSDTETFTDLSTIKQKYNIKIYSNNSIIYDSDSNQTYFNLHKNSTYNVQIKLKNNYPEDNYENLLLFIRFYGNLYNDLLFNKNQINFLYKLDHEFKNDIVFENNLNALKQINFNNALSAKNIFTDKMKINSNNINNTENLFHLENEGKTLFSILHNQVSFGTPPNLIDSNKNLVFIKNNDNKDSIHIFGNAENDKDIHIKDNLNVLNNCTVLHNINSKHIIANNLYYHNNPDFNLTNNINCSSLNSNNLILNSTKLIPKTFTTNFINNTEIFPLKDLANDNIIIDSNKITMNSMSLDINGNLNINSDECFNKFTIGGKTKPNLSISANGYTIINTSDNGFYLNNINVLEKINLFKNNIPFMH